MDEVSLNKEERYDESLESVRLCIIIAVDSY